MTGINPLGKRRMDRVLNLKNNASKIVMESQWDSENAERILYNMNPRQLDQIRRQVRQHTILFEVYRNK